MKIVTSKEMREIDSKTITEYKIPGCVLMEKAGYAVASKIKELHHKNKVIVFSGSGNNGGDGMVTARILKSQGHEVIIILLCVVQNIKGDALTQYYAALKYGIPFYNAKYFLENHTELLKPDSIIVDAIFGTGLNKEITGEISEIINLINSSKLPVISVDIPSGISSDTGQILGTAIKAKYTVTFGLPKKGHLLYPGAEYTGNLFIENIGFPEELLESDTLKIELLEKNKVSLLIPERRNYSHKGNYGHVLIIAGSKGKTGAAFLSAHACLRTGAGLVTIGIPETLSNVFQQRVTEEMTLILPDKGNGTLSEKALSKILNFAEKNADLIAIGPGIGVSNETEKIVKALIVEFKKPIIIDADGLNSIKGDKDIFKKAKSQIILTPHPGEMSRLINSSVNNIENDRINKALSFATDTGTFTVLKGVPTVIASPDGMAYINSTGNPGMASAGSGDVLTGMISGFLAQQITPINSCILGVYMHGFAGDIAAMKKGMHSLIASDIIENIPEAFKAISGNKF